MLMRPPRCWRGRADCDPLHSVEGGLPADMTDADWQALETGALQPGSFVCCGLVDPAARAIAQDAYRLCWKNAAVDEMGDHDEQDLAHQGAVIAQALAIVATRRVNGGTIDVPTRQGEPSPPLSAVADSGCPACGASEPHLHPAFPAIMGRDYVCPDAFHLTPTAWNTPDRIALVEAERSRRGGGGS